MNDLLNSEELPPDVSDPAFTQTPEGAIRAYNGALAQFRTAMSAYVKSAGLLTDELSATNVIISIGGNDGLAPRKTYVARVANTIGEVEYSALNKVRGQATQAIDLITHYAPEKLVLAGHLYGIKGYAELLLAELFCSGIPLSTIDFDGGLTYRPGSTTQAVLDHAAALFDTAVALSSDSVRFANLARIGRARALLGVGDDAAAAMAAAAVPDSYRYNVNYAAAATTTDTFSTRNFAYMTSPNQWNYTVEDGEGINGLDWRMSGDPRTQVTQVGTYGGFGFSGIIYHPDKYAVDGSSPIVLASGVEARLIEAETELRAGDTVAWLGKLNALRTDGAFDTTATTPPDTLWHAGSGGVAGLAPLVEPGTSSGRVDLQFRERAFWLFLTGHRQGDLRRLIRQYGRFEDEVYPTGPYQGGVDFYGSDVTVPVPLDEAVSNPLYTGCFSRTA